MAVENDACANDDHTWKFISDWEGNPDVPNGTRDVSYYVCIHCGYEATGSQLDSNGTVIHDNV